MINMSNQAPNTPTLVTSRRKKDPASGWVRVPVISNLHDTSGRDTDKKATYGGMFGSMEDDQAKVHLEMDRNQRMADRKLRIAKYNLSVAPGDNSEETNLDSTDGRNLKKVVSFSEFNEPSGHSTATSIAAATGPGAVTVRNQSTAAAETTTPPRGIQRGEGIHHSLQSDVVHRILKLSAALVVLFFAVSSTDSRLAQQYLGADHFTFAASVMKSISASRSSGIAFNGDYRAEEILGMGVMENMRAELLRLRGCGDALFPSASTYIVTDNLFKNKKCATTSHRQLESSEISNHRLEDVIEAEKEIENKYFQTFITDMKTNGITIRDNSILSGAITQPVHSTATLSSMLSWEFNCDFLPNSLTSDALDVPVKIFLDVRVNGRMLHFPGGNLIDVTMNKDSDPISMSCNLAEHGFGPGSMSAVVQAIFTVNNGDRMSYAVSSAEVMYYYVE